MSADPVWATRVAVAPLRLGAPEPLSAVRLDPQGPCAEVWTDLQALADASLAAWDDRAALSTQLGLARTLMARVLGDQPLPPDEIVDCCVASEPHDAYFRIVRTGHPPAEALLYGLLQGLLVFTDEVKDEGDYRDYGIIPRSLTLVWCDLMGHPVPETIRKAPTERPAMQRQCEAPVRRWLRGHQVFAALTQALIWSMHQLPEATRSGAHDAAEVALCRVRLLMDASAAAFRFTSDFDPLHYRETIRPSMSEPHVPPGFSGTLSLDHAHLVRMMSGLRAELVKLQGSHPEAYAAMSQALSNVYEDHKFVCEQFDGAQAPSLKGATSRQSSQMTGAEMLDRFKTRRMVMVG